MGRKRGRERERRKAERSSLAGQSLESLSARLREEGWRYQLSCELRELLISIQI